MKKTILAIQLSSKIEDYDFNKNKVETMLQKAVSTFGAPDILFLPEVWTLGWYTDCFQKLENKNSYAPVFLSSLAKKYGINIIGGSYIRKGDEGYFNTCPVINREGEICALYDKIHLYSPDGEAKQVLSGKTPLIVDIEGLKIGLSICYDIRFPELFRSYIASNNPPHLLVNMSAWPKTRRSQYDSMAKCRAVENQAYFLALSQAGEIKDSVFNSGYSTLVGPLGDSIKTLDEDEGFIFETIDTDEVDRVRNTYPNLLNRKVNDFGFRPQFVKMGGERI